MGPNESKNLWISLGAGIFATFMLYSYTQEKKAEMDKTLGEKVRVVVAKEDVREMETVYDNMLEIKEKLKDEVEPDAYRDIGDVLGTVTAIPIKKGQTITKNKVLEPGPETGMAIQVAPGMRAVTIPIDETRANAKLIRPGDRVDIFAVVDSGKGAAQVKQVVLYKENTQILATGVNVHNNLPRTIEKDASGKGLVQNTLTGDTKYNSLTIEVGAIEAQDLIALVSTNPGSLYFLLRNPHDKGVAKGRVPASTPDSVLQKMTSPYGQSSGYPAQNLPNYNGGQIKPGN
jgi:pilus assembly protein CpaB